MPASCIVLFCGTALKCAPVQIGWNGEPLGRKVEESGNGKPVERLPLDQLGLGELRGIQAAGFAFRPAFELAGQCIDRVNIRRRARRCDGESQIVAIRMEP